MLSQRCPLLLLLLWCSLTHHSANTTSSQHTASVCNQPTIDTQQSPHNQCVQSKCCPDTILQAQTKREALLVRLRPIKSGATVSNIDRTLHIGCISTACWSCVVIKQCGAHLTHEYACMHIYMFSINTHRYPSLNGSAGSVSIGRWRRGSTNSLRWGDITSSGR